jgi:hypothetical protein
VTYPSVLDGVDLVYHGDNGHLEYDFVVAPGTSPERVAMDVSGAQELALSKDGDLVIKTGAGDLVQPKPLVYQLDADGTKRTVAAGYRLVERSKVGFEVASYDRSRPLVIDPVIAFATYLGGTSEDQGRSVATGADGSTYVTGWTQSSAFPTKGAYDASFNLPDCEGECFPYYDAFVSKFDKDGGLVYSTYLGGTNNDYAYGIAVNNLGEAFVTGRTGSNDFPATDGAYQTQHASGFTDDGFVTRLSADGTQLGFSTYLSLVQSESPYASGREVIYAVAVDANSNVYVTGERFETELGQARVTQAVQEVVVSAEAPPGFTQGWAFAAKLNATGSELVYGPVDFDLESAGEGIKVNSSGEAFLVGYARNFEFTTVGTPLGGSTCGGKDTSAFFAHLAANGAKAFVSCYGGNGNDYGTAVALDATGDAWITGWTSSSDLPTVSPFQANTAGGEDAFVARIRSSDNTLTYSTYLGGSSDDHGWGITADSAGTVWIAGETRSFDLPRHPSDPTHHHDEGGEGSDFPDDAFILRLNSAGSSLLFSMYFGGAGNDTAYALSTNGSAVSVAGTTSSPALPVINAHQPSIAGEGFTNDAFVASVVTPPLLIAPTTVTLATGASQQFEALGGVGFGYTYTVQINNSSGSISPTGLYTAGATGNVGDTVRVQDPTGAAALAQVTVTGNTEPTPDLQISPTSATVTPRGARQFSATGGVPPYSFSFVSNASSGTITPSGGYTAGSTGNTNDIVRVIDAAGSIRTALIVVGGPLKITPAAPQTAPKGTISFSATGGSGSGYTWSLAKNGSGASIIAGTGAYTAGSGTNAVDTVSVTDSLGNKTSVNVSVGGGLAVDPAAPATSPKGTIAFTAFGGSGSFTWSFASNASGGTINPVTGTYVAGPNGNVTDAVLVTDSLGNSASVPITVGPVLSIAPPLAETTTGGKLVFTGAGGSGAGYLWSIPSNQSGGVVVNGAYTAGTSAGTDQVRLTDSLGNVATATVTVRALPSQQPDAGTTNPQFDGGAFNTAQIGGGSGDDDCSCEAVGSSHGTGSPARVFAGLALVLGLVLRRRRR